MKEIIVVGAVAAAIVGGIVWLAVEEGKEWNAFKQTHACRKVAHVRGHVQPITGFDSKGNVTFSTVTTPDKTGWLCDDGVTYYR